MVEVVQSLTKRLKGCSTSKKNIRLERICKEAYFKIRRSVLNAIVRWNSAKMMLTRFLFVLPALRLIKEEDMPTSSDNKSLWSQLLRIANN